jgi:hypothetical protein
MTSKKWYWLAGGLVLAGIASGAAGCRELISKIDGLHRVVMPARAEIALPAGDTTLYTEQRSIVDGKVYEITGDLQFRCGIADPTGKPVPLQHPSSSTRYSFGDHAGRNTFDLHAETAGTYVLTCEAPSPFVIAIGSGIGTQIVIAVLGGLIPTLLGVLTFVLVLVRRRKQRWAERLRPAAPM